MDKKRLISLLALFASFFALCVIGLGAFTRLIDAGLGCPDWPGCYGHITVPLSAKAKEIVSIQYPGSVLNAYKAWAEMIHRYFAGALGVLILGVVGLAFTKTVRTRGNVILALGILLLLTYQILLGQWTVTMKLWPIVVTQHLMGGFLILSVLWLIYLNNSNMKINQRIECSKIRLTESDTALNNTTVNNKTIANSKAMPNIKALPNKAILNTKAIPNTKAMPNTKAIPNTKTMDSSKTGLIIGAIIALIMLFLQISLGAWTSTNYASLSCPDFPFCVNAVPLEAIHFKAVFNLFLPVEVNYEGGVLSDVLRQSIQMTHRLGALVFITYMLIYSAMAIRKLTDKLELLKSIYLIWGLIFVQLCLGIINIVYKLPLVTAVSHTIIAAVLLLAMITYIYKLLQAIRHASNAAVF